MNVVGIFICFTGRYATSEKSITFMNWCTAERKGWRENTTWSRDKDSERHENVPGSFFIM